MPRGDGRLVLVLPGLFANDLYLHPLRKWLTRVGYRPVRSTLAINVGCPERLCVQIESELARQQERHGGPIAIIGHSRGGILARAIAARLQADAATLVLLGSPVGAVLRMPSWSAAEIAADPPARRRVTDAGTSVRRMIDPDCNVPECGCAFPPDLRRKLHKKTKVVSIYSRDDPIVPAAACPVAGARNVEVGDRTRGWRSMWRCTGSLRLRWRREGPADWVGLTTKDTKGHEGVGTRRVGGRNRRFRR